MATDHARVARRANVVVNRCPSAARRWSRVHARLYRLSRGRLLGRWFRVPVLVVQTVGRRTGKPRSTPVLYLEHEGAFVVLAANAGAHLVPAWWLNIKAVGGAVVHLDGRAIPVRAVELQGAARDRAWLRYTALFGQAEEYTRLTGRAFPLIALVPAEQTFGRI